MAAITRESELIAKSVATAVALPLATSAYSDVAPVLNDAMADSRTRGNKRIDWLLVTDADGGVVQRTEAAPSDAELAPLRTLAQRAELDKQIVQQPGAQPAHSVLAARVRLSDKTVGAVLIGISTEDLENSLRAGVAAAQDKARALRLQMLLLAAGVLAVGVLLAFVQGVQLARPIRQLTRQAARIAAGQLEQRVAHARRDEVGVLAHTFNHMTDRLNALIAENAQKASLEREMSLARMVQQAMLPTTEVVHCGAFAIAGVSTPASMCGGDWWSYRQLGQGRVLLVLGDATGHGIHSAMIAATARGAVEALSSVDERLLDPESVLRAAHAAICSLGEHNVLMTAFAAVFDANAAVVHYANAGQNFPYLVNANADGTLGKLNIIAAAGNPLGDRAIAQEIRRGARPLVPGDVMVVFSDGVVERANSAGKAYGDRRLRVALQGQTLTSHAQLGRVRDHVLATVEQHAAGLAADDDITLVLCRFAPAPDVIG